MPSRGLCETVTNLREDKEQNVAHCGSMSQVIFLTSSDLSGEEFKTTSRLLEVLRTSAKRLLRVMFYIFLCVEIKSLGLFIHFNTLFTYKNE